MCKLKALRDDRSSSHAFQRSGGSREQLWLDTPPMRERKKEYLFTFLKYEGVEPINSIAERTLRPSEQWRKICFGFQSDTGLRFTEQLLSVVGTRRLHGVNLFHFLIKVIKGSFSGKYSLPDLSSPLQQ